MLIKNGYKLPELLKSRLQSLMKPSEVRNCWYSPQMVSLSNFLRLHFKLHFKHCLNWVPSFSKKLVSWSLLLSSLIHSAACAAVLSISAVFELECHHTSIAMDLTAFWKVSRERETISFYHSMSCSLKKKALHLQSLPCYSWLTINILE